MIASSVSLSRSLDRSLARSLCAHIQLYAYENEYPTHVHADIHITHTRGRNWRFSLHMRTLGAHARICPIA